MTSSAEDLLGVYQYIINLQDSTIEGLLYRLTFLPDSAIKAAVAEQRQNPDSNFAKIILARELLAYITGSYEHAERSMNYSKYFTLEIANLRKKSHEDIKSFFKRMPNTITMSRSKYTESSNVLELLKDAHIRPSLTQVSKLAKAGSLKLNDQKVEMDKLKLSDYELLADSILVVKSGKKEYHTLILS